jgi:hypothetical protein
MHRPIKKVHSSWDGVFDSVVEVYDELRVIGTPVDS